MSKLALVLVVLGVVGCTGGGGGNNMSVGDGGLDVVGGEGRGQGECAPGEKKCVGAMIMTCNDDGSGWVSPEVCAQGEVCAAGACCLPSSCDGVACGSDGCGGECGACEDGFSCVEGQCIDDTCEVECAGKVCGDDGCGGSCGGCDAPQTCCEGACCQAECGGKECGSDGCCGDCGECAQDGVCVDGQCCVPDCQGLECGDDGCDGSCGECGDGVECAQGQCCAPECDGKSCGDDGCGGLCGECEPWFGCADGICSNVCVEACQGRACGPDGCGGLCGLCPGEEICSDDGLCLDECTGSCVGKQCGTDGCGGKCGAPCPAGTFCDGEGLCTPNAQCVPDCLGKQCGKDGCSGLCGECGDGIGCTIDGQCSNYCAGCDLDDYCANLNFEAGNLVGWHVEGDGRVVPSLGATEAPEGVFMGLVSSGSGKAGLVSFESCVGSDVVVEKAMLKMKFYSEEFTEYCGSVFQDSVNIYLEKDGANHAIFSADIRDFCPPETPNCNQCGSLYSTLEPADIELDQGGVFMTDWIDVESDILGFVLPGEPFKLIITVTDGSDAKFDSLALVDDIRFTPCIPECEGKNCGDDGCGGVCGECPETHICAEGVCECIVVCDGKFCGDDGCGGSCGDCSDGFACVDFLCVPCTIDCSGKECGDDGCGGICGACDEGQYCSSQGLCLTDCVVDCQGKECGDDGCGGSCGDCDDNNMCTSDKCNPTLFSCVSLPQDGECDDGDDMTVNDQCVDGECVGEK